ncbi:hypothetical protein HZH68_013211 [Vespula germanica]|uniref:Uncharacterized protein n=3 Tax=Vespula TaxID=7451 RepID=A0A834JFP9_VESGE|nr:uncharacterized protein LOC122634169 isoform X1 [Vespula pensylvanica]XP_050861055.1 uncharacterized protein LOC127068819 isoform X1 [Vespula vulgaris]KAF7385874.1 hypothetical protein HZH66_011716 [Vespula vulgaris]KAF7387534.1 hypothetical protein HZH68_013211 [Vespula germanica]KAF7409009.1 hypothetical protein H0235_013861 [Vespula pensylvanica]
MGVSEINMWILIRRYDQIESENDTLQTTLNCFTVVPGVTLDELRISIYYWAGIEKDNNKVLKIRRHDNNLIPLSSLLRGSHKDKPFIIDVVGVHQFCPVEERSLPPGYLDAFKSKLANLEKRVMMVESFLPNMTSSHTRAVETMVTQLTNCVNFLDHRLDELAPQCWKSQIQSAAS